MVRTWTHGRLRNIHEVFLPRERIEAFYPGSHAFELGLDGERDRVTDEPIEHGWYFIAAWTAYEPEARRNLFRCTVQETAPPATDRPVSGILSHG